MRGADQRGFGTTASWLIIWVVIALFTHRGVTDRTRIHQLALRMALNKELQKTKEANQNELILLEQDLKRKAREASTRRSFEIEKAWGDPISAAFKNPAYSLREALQHAAEACAPTNAVVRADVDRFTEFTVTIDSGAPTSTNEMIMVARRLIPLSKEYLTSLRFSTRGKLSAEIDREDIEFISDWTRTPDQRIAMLLSRESQSRIAQDPAAIERFRDEQRISQALAAQPELREKAQRADRNLRQAVQNAYGELTTAFESLQKSVSFGEIRSLRDLDRCEKELRATIEHVDRARKFWADPTKEWQRLVGVEGISGELFDVLVKSFPAIFRNDQTKTDKVFEALNGEIESCRHAMRLLGSESDKWKFSGGGIAFTDDDFARRFERAQRQIREDAQGTQAALRAWNEAIGP